MSISDLGAADRNAMRVAMCVANRAGPPNCPALLQAMLMGTTLRQRLRYALIALLKPLVLTPMLTCYLWGNRCLPSWLTCAVCCCRIEQLEKEHSGLLVEKQRLQEDMEEVQERLTAGGSHSVLVSASCVLRDPATGSVSCSLACQLG